MRGPLMRLFTKEQHIEILENNPRNAMAALQYKAIAGVDISEAVVRYWRKIFIDAKGNLAAADRELKNTRVIREPDINDDLGDLSFIPTVADSILVIPDQHAPYQHPDTLDFLQAVKAAFDPQLVVNLGDELDYHALSFHDSDPALDSAGVELEKGKRFLKALAKLFPDMLVCHSNHGSMAFRRAKAHGIPVQLIKQYRDIAFDGKAPNWSWAYSWRINTPLGEVLFKHQTSGLLTDAAHNSANLVVGHEHGKFDIEYSASSSHLYYGMHCGCLVDKNSLAFAYGKHSLRKPIIGCGVILQGRPCLVPMVLRQDGRWIGRL